MVVLNVMVVFLGLVSPRGAPEHVPAGTTGPERPFCPGCPGRDKTQKFGRDNRDNFLLNALNVSEVKVYQFP